MNIIKSAVERDLLMCGVGRVQNWLSGLGTQTAATSRTHVGCNWPVRYADWSVWLWILLYFVIVIKGAWWGQP